MLGKQLHSKHVTPLQALLQRYQYYPDREYIFNARDSNNEGAMFCSVNQQNDSRSNNMVMGIGSRSRNKLGLFGKLVGQLKSREPLQEVLEQVESKEINIPFEKVKLQIKPNKFGFKHPKTT